MVARQVKPQPVANPSSSARCRLKGLPLLEHLRALKISGPQAGSGEEASYDEAKLDASQPQDGKRRARDAGSAPSSPDRPQPAKPSPGRWLACPLCQAS
jgi:hypothetical protein